MRPLSMFLLVPAVLPACAPPGEGLRRTPPGDGPTVVVDWDAEPLPEIPFPNDLATRVDRSSPTGLRVNISQEAVTVAESEARAKLDELTGFGIYAPITVAFDAPLDLDEILARQANDFHRDEAFDDDAFYLIDVDPASPRYLEPVELDVGHGRYPVDIEGSDRYFPNDPRADMPTIMFESADEDVNGNGVLDWGEDTDNDGVLDQPNVHPRGGDPRDDLLTFYERETNTLIVRPVVPLREEGRYAMVLTERLVGEDGQPVRSPWEYVHHLRQTEALRPVLDALPAWGLSADDIAYAWVFSTGRVTGDLVDIRRGFDGEGPWPFLATQFPPGIDTAARMHDLDDYPPQLLPSSVLIDSLAGLGLFDGPEGELMSAAYGQYGGAIVGGSFTAPDLLLDRDGLGDDSDAWWQLDPVAGTMRVEAERLVFTCLIPDAAADDGPMDVVLFGHGHTTSRLDMLLFGWAINRVGMASCAVDYPGHGFALDADLEPLVETLLDGFGLGAFYTHIKDARARDLDNDGIPDSGADQWISDPFHSRDTVRQAVVEQMQFVRALKTCGTGTMDVVEPDGAVIDTVTSCDWDGDGAADLGGPDVDYYVFGGSLGGINSAVAAAVMPEVRAFSPVVPGGGLLDVAVRSDLGGVVSAVIGRMITPLILGLPTDDGGLQVVQYVNGYLEMHSVPVATLPSVPAGGRVVVENLDNGEVREGFIPEDGRFRVAIPADALSGVEKRELTGMPDTGPEIGVTYSVPDNEGLGDRLVITLYDADGTQVASLDSWQDDTIYEGITMPAGSPLVAASHGSGHIRGTPALRRLAMATSMALEPGDPVAYAPHWFLEPFEELGGRPANVLVMPNVGDQGVTVSGGLGIARAAGLVERHEVDDRYGMTVDQWLIAREVLHGLEEYGPYTDADGNPALFDPDDLDFGLDGTGAPSEEPLRATVPSGDGVSGLRMPYPKTTGMHGVEPPDGSKPWDAAIYLSNVLAWYFATGGTEIVDDPCLGANDCDFLPPIDLSGVSGD
ncbi:MAG: hypothetical protein D6798_20650 [Deltaproteobacteria bacterium]|nr:MAG: hypothetical protein D6798_20650 [Deltaproteobacteria bacterium]